MPLECQHQESENMMPALNKSGCISKLDDQTRLDHKREYARKWRKKNVEHIRIYQHKYAHQYYRKNRERIIKKTSKYRRQHPDYMKAWRKENAGHVSIYHHNYHRQYYHENRERIIAKVREYRQEHPEDSEKKRKRGLLWRKKNMTPERNRKNRLKFKFGISPTDYSNMIEKQKGVCGVCKQPPNGKLPLVVDHDHVTENVRGLLCVPCNLSLSWLEETEWLEKAVAYLQRGS